MTVVRMEETVTITTPLVGKFWIQAYRLCDGIPLLTDVPQDVGSRAIERDVVLRRRRQYQDVGSRAIERGVALWKRRQSPSLVALDRMLIIVPGPLVGLVRGRLLLQMVESLIDEYVGACHVHNVIKILRRVFVQGPNEVLVLYPICKRGDRHILTVISNLKLP